MMIGTSTTVAATPTVMSEVDIPCRSLSLRSRSNSAGTVWIGNSSMTGPDDAYGFVEPGETFGFQSFMPASGMRPSEVYLIGEAGDKVHWAGWIY